MLFRSARSNQKRLNWRDGVQHRKHCVGSDLVNETSSFTFSIRAIRTAIGRGRKSNSWTSLKNLYSSSFPLVVRSMKTIFSFSFRPSRTCLQNRYHFTFSRECERVRIAPIPGTRTGDRIRRVLSPLLLGRRGNLEKSSTPRSQDLNVFFGILTGYPSSAFRGCGKVLYREQNPADESLGGTKQDHHRHSKECHEQLSKRSNSQNGHHVLH